MRKRTVRWILGRTVGLALLLGGGMIAPQTVYAQ